MSDERRDYAILVRLYMREEAEVMASALRAEGIDAFVANSQHAYFDWHYIIALGGLQVMVPREKLQHAQDFVAALLAEAPAEPVPDPEGEPVSRRDRWKLWAIIAGYSGLLVYALWLNTRDPIRPVDFAPTTVATALFSAPAGLSAPEREAVLLDYCLDYPGHRVHTPGDPLGDIIECGDILFRN